MTAPAQWLKTCPVCGQDNQCAVMAGRPADTCWCAGTAISPEALAAVPADSIGKRCLCPGCARSKGDTPDER
ncbi:MAG: cysteine-rich CWC family protein [Pseudomonadales bacterium]|nr:cysteine-rich CWC family protein [Halioglobus sp.]MCP5131524.1 cysteine-rich CWC family protein [Pseudomonadales bacterium]